MGYVTYQEFIGSPHGADFQPGECSIFASSGDVASFLDYISSVIDLYAGQTFSTGNITMNFRSNGELIKYFDRMPLNSINSITWRSPYNFYYGASSGALTPNDYYYYNDGKIVFNNYLYKDAIYSINANCGYATTPQAIKMATLMLANVYATAAEKGAVATPDGGATAKFAFNKFEETYTDSRQRYDSMEVGIPVTVYTILQRYRFLR